MLPRCHRVSLLVSRNIHRILPMYLLLLPTFEVENNFSPVVFPLVKYFNLQINDRILVLDHGVTNKLKREECLEKKQQVVILRYQRIKNDSAKYERKLHNKNCR